MTSNTEYWILGLVPESAFSTLGALESMSVFCSPAILRQGIDRMPLLVSNSAADMVAVAMSSARKDGGVLDRLLHKMLQCLAHLTWTRRTSFEGALSGRNCCRVLIYPVLSSQVAITMDVIGPYGSGRLPLRWIITCSLFWPTYVRALVTATMHPNPRA